MAAKKGKTKEAPQTRIVTSITLLSVLVKAAIAIGAIGGLIAGIVWLGNRAGKEVANQPRYTVPFSHIESLAPPGSDRLAFLTEVRYLSSLPETLQTVEPGLAERLTTAFQKHPWVQSVQEVKITPDAKIQVSVTFRVPVLAVKSSLETDWRAVARGGVLLPTNTQTEELPQLVNTVLPPTRPAGELWDDPTIRRAAELVELYRDQKPSKIEKISKGWRLTLADGKTVVVSL